MKKLLIPLVLLALGLGGGVGAGLVLAPAPAAEACATPTGAETAYAEPDAAGADAAPCEEEAPAQGEAAEAAAETTSGDYGAAAAGGHEYVKLPNQFVVPLMEEGRVAALMLVSLSVEVPAGSKEAIAPIEPKLRDAFLQALFDHANTDGFEGLFTASGAMRPLRAALLQAAQGATDGLVTDVLIVDLVRDDR